MADEDSYKKTPLNTVRRLRERGSYDVDTVNAILDEALIGHFGFVDSQLSEGYPMVIPMLYGRDGDKIYFHGSSAARILKRAKTGIPMTMTVTLVDGLVLARSVFHHSANYRSACVFGTCRLLEDDAQKLNGLRVITDHTIRGRWEDARVPDPDTPLGKKELDETHVIEMTIETGSAKVRTGGPHDDDQDYNTPELIENVWAGVIPLHTTTGQLEPDEHVPSTLKPQDYLTQFDLATRNN